MGCCNSGPTSQVSNTPANVEKQDSRRRSPVSNPPVTSPARVERPETPQPTPVRPDDIGIDTVALWIDNIWVDYHNMKDCIERESSVYYEVLVVIQHEECSRIQLDREWSSHMVLWIGLTHLHLDEETSRCCIWEEWDLNKTPQPSEAFDDDEYEGCSHIGLDREGYTSPSRRDFTVYSSDNVFNRFVKKNIDPGGIQVKSELSHMMGCCCSKPSPVSDPPVTSPARVERPETPQPTPVHPDDIGIDTVALWINNIWVDYHNMKDCIERESTVYYEVLMVIQHEECSRIQLDREWSSHMVLWIGLTHLHLDEETSRCCIWEEWDLTVVEELQGRYLVGVDEIRSRPLKGHFLYTLPPPLSPIRKSISPSRNDSMTSSDFSFLKRIVRGGSVLLKNLKQPFHAKTKSLSGPSQKHTTTTSKIPSSHKWGVIETDGYIHMYDETTSASLEDALSQLQDNPNNNNLVPIFRSGREYFVDLRTMHQITPHAGTARPVHRIPFPHVQRGVHTDGTYIISLPSLTTTPHGHHHQEPSWNFASKSHRMDVCEGNKYADVQSRFQGSTHL